MCLFVCFFCASQQFEQTDKWTNEPNRKTVTKKIGWKEAKNKNNYETNKKTQTSFGFYVSIGIKHVSLRAVVQKTLLLSTHRKHRILPIFSISRMLHMSFVRIVSYTIEGENVPASVCECEWECICYFSRHLFLWLFEQYSCETIAINISRNKKKNRNRNRKLNRRENRS